MNTVTERYINSRIATTSCFQMWGTTLTVCVIILDNGFTVTGESACIDPIKFNLELGERLAYEDAYSKLWGFFGFMAKEDDYRAGVYRHDVPAVLKEAN